MLAKEKLQGKLQYWQTVQEYFSKVSDGHGTPIEHAVFEAVVALNALGLKTHQSCEGHLDHGTCGPWIMVVNVEARELYRQAGDAMEQAQQKAYSSTEQRALYARYHALKGQADALIAVDHAKLLLYLRDFYELHPTVSHDCRLTAYSRVAGYVHLECLGTRIQPARTEEEKACWLQVYREEMQAFAAFLKQLYVASEEVKP